MNVVQVRARPAVGITALDKEIPYLSGKDPVTGRFYAWSSAYREAYVDDAVLAQLRSDSRLEIRVLDVRAQAEALRRNANEASKAATAAETTARELRAHADALELEAMAAEEALAKLPAPEPTPPAPTPYQDQLLASLPDKVRAEIENQKLNMHTVREQIRSATVDLATKGGPNGALAEAKAQAFEGVPTQAQFAPKGSKSKKG